MSFQVSYSNFVLRVPFLRFQGQVNYISICQPYIQLSVTLIAPTLQSEHTFKWTQISGAACTVVGSDTGLTVTYAKPSGSGGGDDKVFRLTIDGGFLYQTTFDTTVYSTPIEFVLAPVSTSSREEFYEFTAGQQVTQSQIYYFPVLPGINDPQTSYNGTGLMMMWLLPAASKAPAVIINTTVQENLNGFFVGVQNTPGLHAQFIFPTLNISASYRILTTYKEGGAYTYAMSDTFRPPTIGNHLTADERLNGALNTSNKNEYVVTRITRSLLTLNTPNSIPEKIELIDHVINTSSRNEFVRSAISRSLEVLTVPDEIMQANISTSGRNEYKTTYIVLQHAAIGG